MLPALLAGSRADMSRPQLLATFLLVASAVYSATGLKCFVCDSSQDARCADPFEEPQDLLVECPPGHTYCGWKNSTGGADCGPVTSRYCAGSDGVMSLDGDLEEGGSTTVFVATVCNSDGCNGRNV